MNNQNTNKSHKNNPKHNQNTIKQTVQQQQHKHHPPSNSTNINYLFNPHIHPYLQLHKSSTKIQQNINQNSILYQIIPDSHHYIQNPSILCSSLFEHIHIPEIHSQTPNLSEKTHQATSQQKQPNSLKQQNSIEMAQIISQQYSLFRNQILLQIQSTTQQKTQQILKQQNNSSFLHCNNLVNTNENKNNVHQQFHINSHNFCQQQPKCFKQEFLMLDNSFTSSHSFISQFCQIHPQVESQIHQQQPIPENYHFHYQENSINGYQNHLHTNNFSNSPNPQKYSLSYLQTISVRPISLETFHVNQQTDKLNPSNYQKDSQFQLNLQIGNQHFEHINSVKKTNEQIQTNFEERLIFLSKAYQQKIGIPKQFQNKQIQVLPQYSNIETQTTKNKNSFNISQQNIFSMPFNEQQNLYKKKLQNYLKCHLNFGCQYSETDTGIKISLKRLKVQQQKQYINIDDDIPQANHKQTSQVGVKAHRKKDYEKVENMKNNRKGGNKKKSESVKKQKREKNKSKQKCQQIEQNSDILLPKNIPDKNLKKTNKCKSQVKIQQKTRK